MRRTDLRLGDWLPVEGASWRVSVAERHVPEFGRAVLRQRHWAFKLDGIDELELETQEWLGEAEAGELERFARALARATGWSLGEYGL